MEFDKGPIEVQPSKQFVPKSFVEPQEEMLATPPNSISTQVLFCQFMAAVLTTIHNKGK
jgi:hypothetical protein